VGFTLALLVMTEKRVLKLHPETFLFLVKQLRKHQEEADIFEIDLDVMKVKGDLKVVRMTFPGKQFIGCSTSLDLLKRAASAGWEFLRLPKDLIVDNEFKTLVKNRGTKLIDIE
jgi:hypothetical protein